MRVLIIEDNDRTADILKEEFVNNSFRVDRSKDGGDGLFKAVTENYDVIILDLMLPVMDGLTVLEKMRSSQVETPVIILSAKGSVDDKVTCLRAGGDDYLEKPFSFSELLARIHAVIRRKCSAQASPRVTIADLEVDLIRHKVTRAGTEIILQPLEYQLLEYLARHSGQVVTRKMIIEDVWDFDFEPRTNIIETRICRLREKIDRLYQPKLIHTVKGCGYVLDER